MNVVTVVISSVHVHVECLCFYPDWIHKHLRETVFYVDYRSLKMRVTALWRDGREVAQCSGTILFWVCADTEVH